VAGARAGRGGHRWRQLREQVKARRDPCFHCGQSINWEATYPAPDSFTVDHLKSWIGHPELREDPANLVTAHARCNLSKGAGEARPGLGNLSEAW
jgi:5-methylcytosine-specific restriction endonuclease McrA